MTAESARARASDGAAYRFRPRVLPLPAGLEPVDALVRLRGHRAPVLLDGAAGRPRRFTLLGVDPLRPAPGAPDPRPNAAAGVLGLRPLLASLAREPGDALPPFFAGGFLGALAYDLGVAGEALALPPEPWGQPLVVGGLYVDFLVRDERGRRTWLVLGEDPGDDRPPLAERRERILEELACPAPPDAPAARPEEPPAPLERCVDSAEHRARIERVRAEIERGEIYQANLAHRFRRDADGDPVALYLRLRARNPAPYMGFARWEDEGGRPLGALLSSSPELLLELEGGRARTRPIKGTIARGADEASDAAARARLHASAKDRAELAMIVDLERNDLGRVAAPGTVRVEGFPTLETYATVHHLVADVRATLAPGRDAVDALAALFPGGSVTGAPKLRSMEVIAREEREGRGFFCGSLGLLDTAGRAAFNVLIRTLLWRPRPAAAGAAAGAVDRARGEASFRVGGGITWSSDPAAEDEETLAKGRALAEATEPAPPSAAPAVLLPGEAR